MSRLLFCSNCGNANSDFIHEPCACEVPDFRFGSNEEYQWYVKDPNVQFLTTGQMVDTLKMGEIAEGVYGFYGGSQLTRTTRWGIRYVDLNDKTCTTDIFSITDSVCDTKWIITPHPLMTGSTCVNCKYVEMYGDECPVTDDDDTEHFDDGLMYSCKCFESIELPKPNEEFIIKESEKE